MLNFKQFLIENKKILSFEDTKKYFEEAKKTTKYPPTKTIKVYKLFKQKKKSPNKIFPLFIGSMKPTAINKWQVAENIETKGFKKRPGWHSGGSPYAPHLMKKDRQTMQENRVWALCEAPNDYNWNAVLKKENVTQLDDHVPYGGFYYFNTNKAKGTVMDWRISGAIKVVKILTHEEADNINAKNGINTEYAKMDEFLQIELAKKREVNRNKAKAKRELKKQQNALLKNVDIVGG